MTRIWNSTLSKRIFLGEKENFIAAGIKKAHLAFCSFEKFWAITLEISTPFRNARSVVQAWVLQTRVYSTKISREVISKVTFTCSSFFDGLKLIMFFPQFVLCFFNFLFQLLIASLLIKLKSNRSTSFEWMFVDHFCWYNFTFCKLTSLRINLVSFIFLLTKLS